ncbi:GNAT family N-acetyltransferase [Paracoccus aerodenitrificans]|uniref:GNAT family N-acetyltransferase n=1 Tax=Paracoccus aerodenitrificans TaxID=3017781 RepID=UPI0022F00922|nr:GNAT family N-acetyltransferase [Paracoccus aerodenitrificans]WBU65209.1 GNAT family N-acetyltransferase [Paracoccus aerodenitrificans]
MITLSATPQLETERLILRAPVASDWPHWRDFAMTDRARFVGGGSDKTALVLWRGFGHVIGHWVLRGYGMFVLTEKDSNTPLGMAGMWFPEGWPEHEIGWTIWRPDAKGKGYASEAAIAARDFARKEHGWDDIVSYIVPKNDRSIALAKRLGAVQDPQATGPETEDPLLVFRHPKGDAA